jgi:hypothetical protein
MLPFDLYKLENTIESSKGGTVTVKVKGRSAVHESSGLQDTAHILEDGKSIYNTTLNMSDLALGVNRLGILFTIFSSDIQNLVFSWSRLKEFIVLRAIFMKPPASFFLSFTHTKFYLIAITQYGNIYPCCYFLLILVDLAPICLYCDLSFIYFWIFLTFSVIIEQECICKVTICLVLSSY